MRRVIMTSLSMAVVAMAMNTCAQAALKVGDEAPAFKLTGSDGKTYQLSDFKGKKAVVVAWFPKAFTGGCTKECISFRVNGERIREFNVAYFTASCDTVKDNTAFAKKLELDYVILSDPGKKVAEAYGVVHGDRKVPERWTYVIGVDGKIKHIDNKVKAANHGEDIVSKLAELKIERKK